MPYTIVRKLLLGLTLVSVGCDLLCPDNPECEGVGEEESVDDSGGVVNYPTVDGLGSCEVALLATGGASCQEDTLGGLPQGALPNNGGADAVLSKQWTYGAFYTYTTTNTANDSVSYPAASDIKGHFNGVRASQDGDGYFWLVGRVTCPDVILHRGDAEETVSLVKVGKLTAATSTYVCMAPTQGGITGVHVIAQNPVAVGIQQSGTYAAIDENDVQIRGETAGVEWKGLLVGGFLVVMGDGSDSSGG